MRQLGRLGPLAPFLVLALAMTPGCGAGGPAGPPATVSTTPIMTQADDWSTFAHDQQRTGYEATPGNVNQSTVSQLQLRWSYKSAGKFIASPIAVNGVVYVVDETGQLTALDNATGSVLWVKQLGAVVQMTPSLADGMLFVGTHTAPGKLYALDPLTGNTLWENTVPGAIRSSPVVLNGTVYIGSATGDSPSCLPGGVYSFDEHSGAAKLSWLTEPGIADGGAVWAPISTDGTNLYFGTGNTCVNAPNTNDAIIGANASTLASAWVYNTGGPNWVDDDVGSGVALVGNVGYAVAKNGWLYGLNLSNGQVQMSSQINTLDSYGGFSTPTVTEDTIVVEAGYNQNPYPLPAGTATGGTLYGLSMAGKVKWSLTSTWVMLSSPAATKDLIFASLDNSVDAIDPSSGKELWSYVTTGTFAASPIVVSSGVYANDLSGIVYAFGLPSNADQANKTRAFAGARLGVTSFTPPFRRECFTH